MSNVVEQKYSKRLKRYKDAIELKEPDRVPTLLAGSGTFFAIDAGYTAADTYYDYDKYADAIKKYVERYDLDCGYLFVNGYEGCGKRFEIAQMKMVLWPGMPGSRIDENGFHQFLEFPLIEEDELEELNTDLSGYILTKFLPRAFGLMEPLASFQPDELLSFPVNPSTLMPFSRLTNQPEFLNMIDGLRQLSELETEAGMKIGQLAGDFIGMGYPLLINFPFYCAYDFYSDFLRGTMGSSLDLVESPEVTDKFLKTYVSIQLRQMAINPPRPDTVTLIPMHKGMDGFMSDKDYEKYYFSHLLTLVEAIISYGAIPYVYTEGHYNTRIKFLRNLPKGKCIVHFESGDAATIKKELGDVACLSGFFEARKLEYMNPGEIIDEAKRLIDILAPGGGYVFDFDGGPSAEVKRENYEALMDTIHSYGIY